MKTKNTIHKSFDYCAKHYEQSAKIQREIGQRLFDRLDYIKIKPQRILDLGCGTGLFSQLLKKRYKEAMIVGLDFAFGMLKEAKTKQRLLQKWPLVNADMMQLPFENESFDLVFANQVLHWGPQLPLLFAELHRVMKKEGCLLFSTLGPDTFKEIKQAFQGVDTYQHTNTFIDMHDIGDQLMQTRFLDPVVDMEFITLHYQNLKTLFQNLKDQGVKNINQDRNKGLTGKQAWYKFIDTYQSLITDAGKFPLTYEVVYGHAFKGHSPLKKGSFETFIPISQIGNRLKGDPDGIYQ